MKLNNHPYRTVALLLLVLLAAACTREDDFATPTDNGTAIPAPLTITVTDGAYAPAQSPDDDNSPDTRAVERGYGTEFTKDDKIGLYVVEKEDAAKPGAGTRTVLHENLCLTHDGTGWTLPAGTELTHRPSTGGEILYFAYYPYQSNMEGKVDIYARDERGNVTTEARWFFGNLIYYWTPATDQSTYEAYTASDLMVARGEVAKRTNGTDGSVLSFTMEHQMTLMVFRLPTTKNTYTETIGGVETEEKSYRLYSGMTFPGWLANDDTYRWLVNPTTSFQFRGAYYNASLEKRVFGALSPYDSPGQYFLRTIDGGEETQGDRPLQVGDFYMKDGTIIPHDAFPGGIPADVKADCLGVVFWVGENEGLHWTQTDIRKGDHLLMRDHPGCVHGMVVALRDASAGAVWAKGFDIGNLYEWAKIFEGFNAGEQADWSTIQKSDVGGYGYCSSHLVKLYSAHNSDATFPAYNTISSYATLYPAPGSSSGWYFPNQSEVTMMCYGMARNYTSRPKGRRDFLNKKIKAAGGDELDGKYWTIMNVHDDVWYLDFAGDTNYGYHKKSVTNKVRAVLAF